MTDRRLPRATANLGDRVRRSGYAFLNAFESQNSSGAAIRRIGRIQKVAPYTSVHELRPRDCDDLKNTYSGTFGYGSFPLHTDFAHWFTPPRYLILRSVVGSGDVKTLLLDSAPIVAKIGRSTLQRALMQPRNSVRGHRMLLRMLDEYDDQTGIFRWDSLFLVPATENGRVVVEDVVHHLLIARPVEFTLAAPGDTLVIDNWRILHGRSAVSANHRQRRVERAYLSALR